MPSIEKQLSADGLLFLKHWEGLRLKMYPDSGGKLTIGYGHLVLPDQLAPYANGIDLLTAQRLLARDAKSVVDLLNHTVKCDSLTQSQFDVLVSFIFNIGQTAWIHSTLLKDIQSGSLSDVPRQLRLWCHVDGKEDEGLKNRRDAEAWIWTSGMQNSGQKTKMTSIRTFLGLRT
jgi:lysozyme